MPCGLRLVVGRALSWRVGAAVLRSARVSLCWGQEILPWLLSTSAMRRRAWSWERWTRLFWSPQPTKPDESRSECWEWLCEVAAWHMRCVLADIFCVCEGR